MTPAHPVEMATNANLATAFHNKPFQLTYIPHDSPNSVRSLEPGRAFDIVAGASEHPIKFEWVSESFKTHSLSDYLLDPTHDREVRSSGLHIETTKENGDVSERVTGTFAASWIPKADCSDNCVSIRIRGEFGSITKL